MIHKYISFVVDDGCRIHSLVNILCLCFVAFISFITIIAWYGHTMQKYGKMFLKIKETMYLQILIPDLKFLPAEYGQYKKFNIRNV